MINMKQVISFGFVFLLCFYACTKPKYNTNERLDYFLKISLQIKDLQVLVDDTKEQLNNLYVVKSNTKNSIVFSNETNMIKEELQNLLLQLDKKAKIIESITTQKGDTGLKKNALEYVSQTRQVVKLDLPKLLETIVDGKQLVNNKSAWNRKSRMMMVNANRDLFKNTQKIYLNLYKLDKEQLELYTL